jgi:hypothetical protein
MNFINIIHKRTFKGNFLNQQHCLKGKKGILRVKGKEIINGNHQTIKKKRVDNY